MDSTALENRTHTSSRRLDLYLQGMERYRLQTSRALLFLGLLAYPVFWYIQSTLGLADPEPIRYIAVMVLIALVLVLSFVSKWVSENIGKFIIVIQYLITAHFFITLWIFSLNPIHVIDLFIFLAVLTACVPFIFRTKLSLLVFLMFVVGGSIGVCYSVNEPMTNVFQFLAAVLTFVLVSFFGLSFQMSSLTRLVQSEKRLRNTMEDWRKYDFIVNTSREFMTLINHRYVYEAVNDAYCDAHSKKREEILGHHVGQVWGHDLFNNLIKKYLDECFGGSPVNYQVSFEFPALGFRYFDVTYYPYKNSLGVVTHAVVVSRDNTDRRNAEDKLRHDAMHDALTGLPNRNLLMDRLAHCIRRRTRDDAYHFAALFLDLDRFKVINDSLGHLAGDRLLVSVARALERCLRPGDTVARMGGDEFGILLEDIADVEGARIVANRILREFSLPMNIEGQEVFTGASIGIAMYRAGYARPEEMLRDADTAMYRAKSSGRSRYESFDEQMHVRAKEILALESDLRRALERDEFFLHYQPIMSMRSHRPVGFEALIRWKHSTRGIVSPLDFIQLAEETGLIEPIGQWVLEDACKFLSTLNQLGFSDLFISVNVSARQFQKQGFPGIVSGAISRNNLSPGSLSLELTESVFMDRMGEVSAAIDELGRMGVSLSIDDFGTGYSSMSYLKNLPIKTLKIDQSFVRDILRDSDDSTITGAIIGMAHNLKLQVIAEGVEEPEQATKLLEMGCSLAQGYLYSRPLDVEKAVDFLKEIRTII